jgi:hypothetical protein
MVKHNVLNAIVTTAARQFALGLDPGVLLWWFVLCPSHPLAELGAFVCSQDMLLCIFPQLIPILNGALPPV